MLIKIKGKGRFDLEENLEKVMNLANVVVSGGNIPSEFDMKNPEESGMYWTKATGEQGVEYYNLLPVGNNHWAYVREETDNYVVIEFAYRYGKRLPELLSEIILEVFPLFASHHLIS